MKNILAKNFSYERQDFFKAPVRNMLQLISIICVFIHEAYSIFFIFSNVSVLAISNAVSVLIYVALFYLTKKDYYVISAIIAYFEVLFTVMITSILIGWEFGFYLYAIALVPLVFFCNFKSKCFGILACIFDGAVVISTFEICHHNEPIYPGGHDIVEIIFIINVIICFTLLTFLSYIYSKNSVLTNLHLYEKNKNLQILANTDPLTGLFNRRTMFVKLNEAKFKSMSESGIFSLVLIDIDNFKVTNDVYGHQAGDIVLKEVCGIIKTTLRSDDIICRWGGEEILILLPDTRLHSAEFVAEKLRSNVENLEVNAEGNNISVTITAGVCVSDDDSNINNLITLVDKCLYKGKALGKNCVVSTKALPME